MQLLIWGARIIDTADQYGAGHAEAIIAQAIKSSGIAHDEFIIATKVGMVCDLDSGNIVGVTDDQQKISDALDASLKRLQIDHIDLVKFHLNSHDIRQSEGVFNVFQHAYESGKIGAYGWSNDNQADAMAFAELPGYVAVQHDLNLFNPADEMLRHIEKRGLWSFNRQPLAMGLLTGKYNQSSMPKGRDDIRGSGADWLEYFDKNGRPNAEFLKKIEKIRVLLTQDGRSLAQGALGWVLAQSDRNIPLPGCRTPAQAQDNFSVLDYKPISEEVLTEIDCMMR